MFRRREPDLKPALKSDPNSLAADRLVGCKAIAEFWFGSSAHKYERQMFHLLEERKVPCGKIGGSWYASKRALTAHHERLGSGQAAD